MSEELLIRHCSPTLAGIKTANMFAMEYTSQQQVCKDIRSLNKLLVPKGLRVIPLKFSAYKALIYIYRPIKLYNDLQQSYAFNMLSGIGYKCDSINSCIAQLLNRVKSSSEFPHEIGLFLGYPPEDVKGFIENKADNYKVTGLWKVYGDEQKAQKLFLKYKKCTEVYYRQWANGKSIEKLTIVC